MIHQSVIIYTLPTGEIVPMRQAAPARTGTGSAAAGLPELADYGGFIWLCVGGER